MSIIIFGGSKNQIKQQAKCKHKWHGPCIDNISRYDKCLICFCLQRDINSEEEYDRKVKESAEYERKTTE